MQPAANPNVWSEILRYFRVSLIEDPPEDVSLKRGVMLSVALTCSQLTEVALDELWRSVTTLEPVVKAFHAPSTTSTVGVRYNGLKKYWDIIAPSKEVASCIPRVNGYLQRVQYLYLQTFPPPREYTLWQILVNLGRPASLCPNLKGLLLDMEEGSPSLMYNLFPLISPSIKDVTLIDKLGRHSGEVMALVLLPMLELHGAQLLKISYKAFASPGIFRHFIQFPSLRSLVVMPPGLVGPGGRQLDESHVVSLGNLTNLTTLEVDIGLFSREAEAPFGRWLATLPELSTLHLRGTCTEIKNCISISLVFNHTRSLSLLFEHDRLSAELFSNIASAFPQLQSLDINASGHSVTLNDILVLKGLEMKSIRLNIFSIGPPVAGVVDILTTWPALRQLSISVGAKSSVFADAKTVLSGASIHGTCLQSLSLRLDLSSLVAAPPTILSPNCPLRKLELFKPLNLPTNLREKHVLARNLIMMFPRLETITSPGGGSDFEDLQAIIDIFQDAFFFPPRRLDHLSYTHVHDVSE